MQQKRKPNIMLFMEKVRRIHDKNIEKWVNICPVILANAN